MSEYNGWANRETWLVNVWYEPSTVSDVQFAREDIEDKVEALGGGIISDMLDISVINWQELEDAMDEEEEDEEEDDDDIDEEDWEECRFIVLLPGESLIDGEPFEDIDRAITRREFWRKCKRNSSENPAHQITFRNTHIFRLN
jgi:hypothetical protein